MWFVFDVLGLLSQDWSLGVNLISVIGIKFSTNWYQSLWFWFKVQEMTNKVDLEKFTG